MNLKIQSSFLVDILIYSYWSTLINYQVNEMRRTSNENIYLESIFQKWKELCKRSNCFIFLRIFEKNISPQSLFLQTFHFLKKVWKQKYLKIFSFEIENYCHQLQNLLRLEKIKITSKYNKCTYISELKLIKNIFVLNTISI